MSILKINDFKVLFELKDKKLEIIKDISLNLEKGEILTIVGSSGSGKSVFTSALFDILPQNAKVSGEIFYNGEITRNLINKAILIPQSSSYLDPLMTVDKQISLKDSKLSNKTKGLYPFQCSGGMIRNAFFDLVHENENADIIIADEPTPGMDVDTALNALSILRSLADKGKSVILITHDIDLAIKISDRVAVFYDGSIIEIAKATDFFESKLRHIYTKALFNALPQNGFVPLDFKKSENVCFCSEICHKFSKSCTETLHLIEYNEGYVRCANAPLW